MNYIDYLKKEKYRYKLKKILEKKYFTLNSKIKIIKAADTVNNKLVLETLKQFLTLGQYTVDSLLKEENDLFLEIVSSISKKSKADARVLNKILENIACNWENFDDITPLTSLTIISTITNISSNENLEKLLKQMKKYPYLETDLYELGHDYYTVTVTDNQNSEISQDFSFDIEEEKEQAKTFIKKIGKF